MIPSRRNRVWRPILPTPTLPSAPGRAKPAGMIRAERPFPWISGFLVLLATSLAALLGGVISGARDEAWYASLPKSALNPPDWTFGLVWPFLFVMMAIGALVVLWRAGSFRRASCALGVYFVMLAVNAAWSLFFFGFKETGLALGVMTALLLLIWAVINEFGRISKEAAWLQVPYLGWVLFAAYLNGFIWASERGLSGLPAGFSATG